MKRLGLVLLVVAAVVAGYVAGQSQRATIGTASAPMQVSDLQVAPQLIQMPAPEYPDEARVAGLEGKVMVEVTIDQNGRVTKAHVVSSNVNKSLEQAAVNSAKQAIFKPAMYRGKPVAVVGTLPIKFSLN